MNAPGGLGLLTRFGVLDIAAKIGALLTDPDTATTVAVLVTSSLTPDLAAGTTAATTTTTSVEGYLSPLATDQITEPYQVGDVSLMIVAADVAATLDAATTWTNQGDGAVYRVITSTLDALGLHWQLVGRRTT